MVARPLVRHPNESSVRRSHLDEPNVVPSYRLSYPLFESRSAVGAALALSFQFCRSAFCKSEYAARSAHPININILNQINWRYNSLIFSIKIRNEKFKVKWTANLSFFRILALVASVRVGIVTNVGVFQNTEQRRRPRAPLPATPPGAPLFWKSCGLMKPAKTSKQQACVAERAAQSAGECHSACNIDPLSRGIGVQN
ncbi:hypothetical protein ACVW1A_006581 [Bradyrhizobium sp. LB1.3]